ncbi:hypothetical protein BN1221_01986c [Brenneria goodwinii]|uniref:Uncharacterized protein n=1 Tax=Brenneria goodwinii TaxID=1109412 RepID=A0A0G4JUF7_9GAMM|nr:hypothetical protein BN1221_01986c [Brenneria goodwinii]
MAELTEKHHPLFTLLYNEFIKIIILLSAKFFFEICNGFISRSFTPNRFQ